MKIDKYDRQIRLWGTKGQKKLAESRIALLGCSGAGIEALKNIVLPGIGAVDIWDNSLVQVQNLCSSFFYEEQSVGKPKGQEALKNLLQMNTDVEGKWINQPPQALLANKQKLKQYTLCISCGEDNQKAERISFECSKNNIPVVFGFQIGFLFYIRNQKLNHFVQRSSSQDKNYLRLADPFDGLKQYSSQWKIANLISQLSQNIEQIQKEKINKVLSRIPFPVILLQLHQTLPQQKRNIKNYRSLLQQWTQKVDVDERRNFRQAQKKVHCLMQTVQDFMDQNYDIFDKPQVVNADNNSNFFSQFMKAVAIYYKKNGHLPQPTTLPDMQTTTSLYIQFKNVYKKQHLICRTEIIDILHNEFQSIKDIDQKDVSFYINNMSGLQMVSMRPYYNQLNEINAQELFEEKDTYISLRVYQIFKSKHKKPPTLKDYEQIEEICKQFCLKNNVNLQDKRYLKQICRAEGKQMININSMMGAVIAQQGVKIVTNCFCPMLSGYIYNGIKCSGAQVNL